MLNHSTVRPVICTNPSPHLKQIIWQRDGERYCFSQGEEQNSKADDLVLAYILPPSFAQDMNMAEDVRSPRSLSLSALIMLIILQPRLSKIFAAFVGDSAFQHLCLGSVHSDQADQLLLLSPQHFEDFSHGRISLKRISLRPSVSV